MTPSFAGLRSTRPRTQPVRGIVLHWTGGLRDPEGVYETLRARTSRGAPDGLSVHYVVGVDGRTVQMAPHELVCLHAGPANDRSVGIEVCSPGLPGWPMGNPLSIIERKRGVHRELYRDRIRRRRVDMLDYTAAQIDAVTLLVETLCDALNVPRRVPLDARGELLRTTMTAAELASFRGLMGHYHCHPTKLDPGTRPLERFRVRWATA